MYEIKKEQQKEKRSRQKIIYVYISNSASTFGPIGHRQERLFQTGRISFHRSLVPTHARRKEHKTVEVSFAVPTDTTAERERERERDGQASAQALQWMLKRTITHIPHSCMIISLLE
jgi:hypothetical protein